MLTNQDWSTIVANRHRLLPFAEIKPGRGKTLMVKGRHSVGWPEGDENGAFVSQGGFWGYYDTITGEYRHVIRSKDRQTVGAPTGRIGEHQFAFLEGTGGCYRGPDFDRIWLSKEDRTFFLSVTPNNIYAYLSSTDGLSIQALDPKTGKKRWQYTAAGFIKPIWANENNVVVVTSRHIHPEKGGMTGQYGITALDPETGEQLWQYDLTALFDRFLPKDRSDLSPRKESTPGPLVDNTFYVGFFGGMVAAIDVPTGEFKWVGITEDTNAPHNIIYRNGKLYFNHDVGIGVYKDFLACMNADTGEQEWQTDWDTFPTGLKNPIMVNQYFIGGASDTLSAYDVDKREIAWTYKVPKSHKFNFGSHLCLAQESLVAKGLRSEPDRLYILPLKPA